MAMMMAAEKSGREREFNGGSAYRESPFYDDFGHNVTEMDAFLAAAIAEAELGQREGGIPIGAVLVHRGIIIGRGHNRRVQQGSSVLHGEMDALERAGRQPASVYRDSIMVTTLSPCAMCSGAILLYGIPRVVVGESRTFLGEEAWLRARGVVVDVLQDAQCIQMMKRFIDECPELWNEDIGR
jgi:cytosine/creatinine deaminase